MQNVPDVINPIETEEVVGFNFDPYKVWEAKARMITYLEELGLDVTKESRQETAQIKTALDLLTLDELLQYEPSDRLVLEDTGRVKIDVYP